MIFRRSLSFSLNLVFSKRHYTKSRVLSMDGNDTEKLVNIIKLENEDDKSWIKSSISHKCVALREDHPPDHIIENNMIEYLRRRGYESVLNTPQAVRTLSSLFTFPTTLAHGINSIYKEGHYETLSVCILGARAEHSLPRSWWLETLIMCPNITSLNITMLGPGILHSPPPFHSDSTVLWRKPFSSSTSSTMNNHTSQRRVVVRTLKDGGHRLFSQLPDTLRDSILLSSDLFVLFHPGLGSPQHKEDWSATLRLLLESRKHILCTALDEMDLERDLTCLLDTALQEDGLAQELEDPLEFTLFPQLNPFRSLRRTFVDGQIVTNNHSIYAFQAK
mmetsp:Transcript_35570/g.36264  ORF Transcript_35570/g.36264 Transcript_35570/m.36264 type:complete len:333 (-) Transcript_35570:34-1032(-)